MINMKSKKSFYSVWSDLLLLSEDDPIWIVEKVLTFDDDLFKFVLSFLLWSKFENDEHFQDRYIPSRLQFSDSYDWAYYDEGYSDVEVDFSRVEKYFLCGF